jgi:hypothetical protein
MPEIQRSLDGIPRLDLFSGWTCWLFVPHLVNASEY